ncbi:glycosyltransferase BC10 isoform X1 [Dendrobium catenatum]|uniref:Core-2/I-branching beta-1,6-N-acetylglucosaminyltransferase family protein n=2 Tax=Dendrobium catenatum TaxID=906689 RepID=A0A2I0VFG1_9ASPA|nr:glycosyltransferase BC10 isoform X1 [Dendrobium catenatum]PKU62157.1 hypothetical protein MA16_Dca020563 [Dendrobium catenatum]
MNVSKSKMGEEHGDFYSVSPKMDWRIRLLRIIWGLVIFMGGAFLGLSVTSRYNQYLTTQTNDLFFPTKMFTTNCDMQRLSIKSFVHPMHLFHDLTDEELFWRATLVPKIEEYPYKRVPKVAFMFLTRGPLPFAPLWDRFFRGHERFYSVYVHSIPNYKLNVSETSAFYERQIPSKEVSWGSISLVDSEKRLLANALLDFSNERFVLLSESCIPVYDFPTVYKYLISSKHSFVESYDEDSPRGRGRYNRHMYPNIKLSKWRKGSQWFELNRELAVKIVADYNYYAIFRRYCKPSCYPDEHYIPTYLNMFHGELNANRTVTWVDWSRDGPHPATYGKENITMKFIQSIRNNGTICTYNNEPTTLCYLFARKFAPNALEPLLNMTSEGMKF